MKGIFPRLLVLPVLLMLMLSACIGREQAERQQALMGEYCQVTYYLGDDIVGQENVVPGKAVSQVPEGDYIWLDAAGNAADLTGADTEEEKLDFYAWSAPVLLEGHVRFLPVDGNQFFPEETLSRAEAAEMLYALLDEKQPSPVKIPWFFSDMEETSPYYEAVSRMATLGVLRGYPDGTFRPDQAITRGEFAEALCRLTGSILADGDSGYWADGVLSTGTEQGWIFGYGDGESYAARAITRAEAVTLINRARGQQPDRKAIDQACQNLPYTDVTAEHWAFYDIIDASYSNDLMAYIIGEAEDAQPGFMVFEDKLCHVNEESLCLDYYTEGFHTIDGGLYYVAQDGYFIERYQQGILELKGCMYYVTEDDGPFLVNGSHGYLDFGEDGRYSSGSETVDQYVYDILWWILEDDTLSQEEKLYEAYCAIRDGGYGYVTRPTGWQRGSTYWSLECAQVMYETKVGVCYYWASAFLYLARRLGFQAYPVCGGVGTQNQLHAWVVIEWDDGQEYIFDVELEWAYSRDFYNRDYTPTNMFKQPINKTKVIYVFPGETARYYPRETAEEEDVLEIPETEAEEVPTPTAPQSPNPSATPAPTATPAATETPVPTATPAPTEAPPVATEAPPVATEAPPVATEAPPVVTEAPPVVTEAPPVATEAPPVITEAPPVVTEAPPVVTEAPPVITEAPPATEPEPEIPVDSELPEAA